MLNVFCPLFIWNSTSLFVKIPGHLDLEYFAFVN